MAVEPKLQVPVRTTPDVQVTGEVVLYRLYDIGYEIDLDRAIGILGDRAPARARPVRAEAQAIQIPNPPVTVDLGTAVLMLPGGPTEVQLSARVFDFGVASFRARLVFPGSAPWTAFTRWGAACAGAPDWHELFGRTRRELQQRIAAAIVNAGESPVVEDYTVFRVNRLTDANGERLPASVLGDEDVSHLLIGEARPLSPAARRDLLSQRFTYFEDDLAVLTWNAALIVEPIVDDSDVQYVVEFANAQLLELRYYDALLDRELPRMYDYIEEARHGFHLFGRRYSRLLSALQARVAEATELVERSENALKMTDDVFLARLYAAALEIFRGRTWRQGIDGKLAIIRDTYTMLNGESQARRSEALEVIIVLLIVIEIGLAFWRR